MTDTNRPSPVSTSGAKCHRRRRLGGTAHRTLATRPRLPVPPPLSPSLEDFELWSIYDLLGIDTPAIAD